MAPRIKKLIGLVILIPGVTLYMFAAAALGERLPGVWFVLVPFYLAAGLLWALPVKYLIQWMNAEPVSKAGSETDR